MKRFLLLAVLLIPAIAFADETKVKDGTMKNGLPYMTATSSVSGHGSVLAVDASTRDVTIKTADGDTVIVTCGPAVKNFAQIAVGDMVKVSYSETLTIHVEESGTPSMTTSSTMGNAKPGEKPTGSVGEAVEFSATITAIDTTKDTVTLKGYRGNEIEVTPRHKENLKKIKVGQLVVVNYSHALAASVVKEAPKSTKKASGTTKK